jgi:hypothetical protein
MEVTIINDSEYPVNVNLGEGMYGMQAWENIKVISFTNGSSNYWWVTGSYSW